MLWSSSLWSQKLGFHEISGEQVRGKSWKNNIASGTQCWAWLCPSSPGNFLSWYLWVSHWNKPSRFWSPEIIIFNSDFISIRVLFLLSLFSKRLYYWFFIYPINIDWTWYQDGAKAVNTQHDLHSVISSASVMHCYLGYQKTREESSQRTGAHTVCPTLSPGNCLKELCPTYNSGLCAQGAAAYKRGYHAELMGWIKRFMKNKTKTGQLRRYMDWR